MEESNQKASLLHRRKSQKVRLWLAITASLEELLQTDLLRMIWWPYLLCCSLLNKTWEKESAYKFDVNLPKALPAEVVSISQGDGYISHQC